MRGSRAATAASAGAVAGLLVLSGCSDGGSGESKPQARGGSQSKQRPSAKPSPRWNPKPASMAALGDSITRGFDACKVLEDCPEVSWATGTDKKVDSLAQRLLAQPKNNSWNFARTGARISDLPTQTDEAIAKAPELVTILIGANDACSSSVSRMTATGTFRTAFVASLEQLKRKLPKTQIYVSSVPNLERLWEVGKDNPLSKQIWKLGICESMLSDPDAQTTAANNRRSRVSERVVEYNAVLKEECAKHALCLYDNGAAYDFGFTESHLSKWDFFHPSKKGQRTLAELAFRRIEAGT